MKRITARCPYTGYASFDDWIERARLAAERDGRLRYVLELGRTSLRKPKGTGFYIIGAESWAVCLDSGTWLQKRYSA